MVDNNGVLHRHTIDAAISESKWTLAEGALRSLWREKPNAATARYITQAFEKMRANIAFAPCRIKILRSFTLEPIVPILKAAAFTHRLDLNAEMGGVNSYTQEILDSSNSLYTSTLDVVVLAIHTRDAAPELWGGANTSEGLDYARRAEEIAGHFRELINNFRTKSSAALIVHNLEEPSGACDGILDSQVRGGQLQALRRINDSLREIAGESRGVYVLDYNALAARQGRDRWFDERMWLTAKLPMGSGGLSVLAEEWLKYLCPLAGRICKVLVTDLDNTLWGGVVGEDGVEGLRLDTEYPGAAFVSVQRALLSLRRRGILLAISSKNNRTDAWPVLETHPNMLLRPNDFTAEFINWDDKPNNLRKIAAQLNIGLDSLAFLDDNHAERDRVRAELPEVTVLELPVDPLGYAAIIRDTPELQRLELSQEDIERGRLYAQRRQGIEASQNYSNVEDFYFSLEQKLEIGNVTPATLARIAQLTQKTNQYNATTKRYSEQQINELASSPGCEVLWARSRDKFGDNGIIAVLITRQRDQVCIIDTFLLSCRVISRGIETALLAFLMERCRAEGIRTVQGSIMPTAKNEPVRSLYERHGFHKSSTNGEETIWTLDLQSAEIAQPEWIKLRINDEQPASEYVNR